MPADGALQLTETQRTARQLHDDQQGPLVSQSVVDRPDAGILSVRPSAVLQRRRIGIAGGHIAVRR